MNRTIGGRAAAGAEWLDEHRPGWWRRISTKRLNMGAGSATEETPECCVGAQLDGDFDRFTDCLRDIERPGLGRLGRLGFIAAGPLTTFTEEYAALTEAWRDEVRARRKAARR